MIFSKLPNEIIHQIYDYDSTYHDKYKNCIKELNGLIKCYPNKLPEIIISSMYYRRYNTIYSINQENISHYNKYILYIYGKLHKKRPLFLEVFLWFYRIKCILVPTVSAEPLLNI